MVILMVIDIGIVIDLNQGPNLPKILVQSDEPNKMSSIYPRFADATCSSSSLCNNIVRDAFKHNLHYYNIGQRIDSFK